MNNLLYKITPAVGKTSGQVTATGAGNIIDTKGYHDVCFLIYLSAVGAANADNKLVFSVEEGDSAQAYDFVAVTREGAVQQAAVVNDVALAASVLKMGFTPGTKRYCRLKFTETGTADATFSVVALLARPEDMPTT